MIITVIATLMFFPLLEITAQDSTSDCLYSSLVTADKSGQQHPHQTLELFYIIVILIHKPLYMKKQLSFELSNIFTNLRVYDFLKTDLHNCPINNLHKPLRKAD